MSCPEESMMLNISKGDESSSSDPILCSPAAVKISLKTQSPVSHERAAISIQMSDPESILDKVLELLANRFPVQAFYQALSNQQHIVKQAATATPTGGATVISAGQVTGGHFSGRESGQVSGTASFNESSTGRTFASQAHSAMYNELIKLTDSRSSPASSQNMKTWIREALATLSASELEEVTTNVSPTNSSRLAQVLMNRTTQGVVGGGGGGGLTTARTSMSGGTSGATTTLLTQSCKGDQTSSGASHFLTTDRQTTDRQTTDRQTTDRQTTDRQSCNDSIITGLVNQSSSVLERTRAAATRICQEDAGVSGEKPTIAVRRVSNSDRSGDVEDGDSAGKWETIDDSVLLADRETEHSNGANSHSSNFSAPISVSAFPNLSAQPNTLSTNTLASHPLSSQPTTLSESTSIRDDGWSTDRKIPLQSSTVVQKTISSTAVKVPTGIPLNSLQQVSTNTTTCEQVSNANVRRTEKMAFEGSYVHGQSNVCGQRVASAAPQPFDNGSHNSSSHHSHHSQHNVNLVGGSHHQSGSHQSGSHQSGSHQSGSHQIGIQQIGSQQIGIHQSGSHQIGSHQSGSHQSGSYHSGSHHSGSHHSLDASRLVMPVTPSTNTMIKSTVYSSPSALDQTVIDSAKAAATRALERKVTITMASAAALAAAEAAADKRLRAGQSLIITSRSGKTDESKEQERSEQNRTISHSMTMPGGVPCSTVVQSSINFETRQPSPMPPYVPLKPAYSTTISSHGTCSPSNSIRAQELSSSNYPQVLSSRSHSPSSTGYANPVIIPQDNLYRPQMTTVIPTGPQTTNIIHSSATVIPSGPQTTNVIHSSSNLIHSSPIVPSSGGVGPSSQTVLPSSTMIPSSGVVRRCSETLINQYSSSTVQNFSGFSLSPSNRLVDESRIYRIVAPPVLSPDQFADTRAMWLTMLERSLRAEHNLINQRCVARVSEILNRINVPCRGVGSLDGELASRYIHQNPAVCTRVVNSVRYLVSKAIKELCEELGFVTTPSWLSCPAMQLLTVEEENRAFGGALLVCRTLTESSATFAIQSFADHLESIQSCRPASDELRNVLSYPTDTPHRRSPCPSMVAVIEARRRESLQTSLNMALDHFHWEEITAKPLLAFVQACYNRKIRDVGGESIKELSSVNQTLAA